MGDSIVIKFTSSSSSSIPGDSRPSSVTPARRQSRPLPWQQRQQQRQQNWQSVSTLVLCHSILEANATADFFIAEIFVIDGWLVGRSKQCDLLLLKLREYYRDLRYLHSVVTKRPSFCSHVVLGSFLCLIIAFL